MRQLGLVDDANIAKRVKSVKQDIVQFEDFRKVIDPGGEFSNL
jgi:hypothetical protein